MRYQEIDDVVFQNKDGNSFTIKDMREYPDYTPLLTLEIDEKDMIDEIASRQEYLEMKLKAKALKYLKIIRLKYLRHDLT